ncbi:hypothetical protein I5Q34_06020 [Streptomyces sp. AV19]|uniref:hypothetical protein n=1 Tax=Streptomyces sp. AV19 TaxID=2793068 RepID=UPI0018FE1839|nr:hypothetical protein [Streptomyces sp. AV19]MBH1933854.1 hypothetical protein [Streptomyces sp. AV19]MDG4533206.1 hypothetical protein [Streptomyces sp. AV19]
MSDLIQPSVPGTRVPPMPMGYADPYVATEFDKTARTWSGPNNLFRTMAWHNGLARTEVDYANSFIFDPPRYGSVPRPDGDPVLFPQTGLIDRVTKELVINLVSLLNRSRYSITHHTTIGFTALRDILPGADPAERARRAEEMLLHLVDCNGRPDFEHQGFAGADGFEPLYSEPQLLCLRLAETIQRDPHSVTDEQFAALRTVFRADAEETVAEGPLGGQPGIGTDGYLDAYVNAMLVELTWCIAHFSGLLNTWFTVLRVMDETGSDQDVTDFAAFYNQQVPERIKVRNNNLLGATGWGR